MMMIMTVVVDDLVAKEDARTVDSVMESVDEHF